LFEKHGFVERLCACMSLLPQANAERGHVLLELKASAMALLADMTERSASIRSSLLTTPTVASNIARTVVRELRVSLLSGCTSPVWHQEEKVQVAGLRTMLGLLRHAPIGNRSTTGACAPPHSPSQGCCVADTSWRPELSAAQPLIH
jgi:hypothetical protein